LSEGGKEKPVEADESLFGTNILISEGFTLSQAVQESRRNMLTRSIDRPGDDFSTSKDSFRSLVTNDDKYCPKPCISAC
jgi:hypothetical protein